MRRAVELALGPALVLLAGRALGSPALTAMGVGLAVVYFGCWYALVVASTRITVVRTLANPEGLEGGAITMDFEVGGLRGLPVHLELLGANGTWMRIPEGSSTLDYRFGHPGRFAIASPMRLHDDLGLIQRVLPPVEPEEVLVLPEPETPATLPPRVGAPDAAQDPEPDGLRPYVPGTPVNRIHWPSAARGSELQERTFTAAPEQLPLVLVDTTGAPSGEALDWAARRAAGHVLALSLAGGCRVLLPGDRRPATLTGTPSQWARLHRRLATLAVGRPSPASGIDLRGAIQVAAAAAPADGLREREVLTPGVSRDEGPAAAPREPSIPDRRWDAAA